MQIRTLTGDDEINLYLMAAMGATVERMCEEGIINEKQAGDFVDKHLCMLISPSSGFVGWFKRIFSDRSGPVIKVVQVNAVKEQPEEKPAETSSTNSETYPVCPVCKEQMTVDTSGLWLCKRCQRNNDRCTWSNQELNEEYRKRK